MKDKKLSKASRRIILNALNNSLRYGKRLLADCDDDDSQASIDIWRTNKEIEKAIKEIENSNCDHSNEVQRQGDGFVYTFCGDCGKDLD